ncbi:MAG: diguanylate cyclase [Gammaproteobacteria bacterium]|nr:diguanylate cyclase [Gammaproteobacteria bacterium]
MKLTAKISLLLALTSVLLLGVLAIGIEQVILPRFAALEEQMLRQDQERLAQTLDSEFQQLSRLARDWGAWDDTYRYLQAPYPEYESGNITPATYDNIQIDGLLLFDAQARLFRDFSYSRASRRFETQSPGFIALLSAQLRQRQSEAKRYGIIEDRGRVMQLALSPIQDSNGEGAPRGTLVMVRVLNDSLVDALAKRLQVRLSFHRLSEEDASPDVALAAKSLDRQPLVVQAVSDETIIAYSQLLDINGYPALLMRVERPRDIWRQGQAATRYLFWFSAAGVLAVGLVFLWMLERGVLHRLKRLSHALLELGDLGRLEERVEVSGDDEIALLAQAANTMLADLQEATHAQQRAAERQREQNATLVHLATHPAFGAGDDEAMRRIIVAAIARGAFANRISFWQRSPGESELSCRAAQWVGGQPVEPELWPLVSEDWLREALEAGEEGIWRQAGIEQTHRSALLMGYAVEDWAGVMCIESLGQAYRWHPDEVTYLMSVNSLGQQYLRGQVERSRSLALRAQAEQDPLTGLANRTGFERKLAAAVAEGEAQGGGFALAFLDLDEFKPINDRHGHAVGDWLLKEVAKRLKLCLRTGDILARLGGDEFTVILAGTHDAEAVRRIGQKIVEAVAEPYGHALGNLRVGASLGLALFPEHGASAEALAHAADMAMYAVKKAGRGACRIYEPGDGEAARGDAA